MKNEEIPNLEQELYRELLTIRLIVSYDGINDKTNSAIFLYH